VNKPKPVSIRYLAVLALAAILPYVLPATAGTTLIAGPADYLSRLKMLQAGDHLQLIPGEYKSGLPVHHLRGGPGRPIVISGSDEGRRPVLIARPRHNTISIVNSSYVTLRNLDLDGQNLPVDGVKCEGHADWAHHITLEGLRIVGHGNNQQTVAISTKCPAWGWVIRNNVISGAGTGIYLGNSDGRAPFVAGMIEHNLVVDSRGYNLQIKHQAPRPLLSGMPDRPSVTVIRHNVFSKANGGSANELARPNVLVGHWPLAGLGSTDRYLIYGNFFHENPNESLFQGEGNIALYNNVFVNRSGDGARIQPHNDTPRKISVFYNTIVVAGSGVSLARRDGDPPYPQLVSANIVFARLPIRGASLKTNLTGELEEAQNYLSRPFAPLDELNLTVAARVQEIERAQDAATFEAYPDAQPDFEGSSYTGKRIGAYALDKSRPRWMPALRIKPVPATQ
jgi:hypothetical protein